MSKILIACEESQAITIQMRKIGLKAFSCDLKPCSGGYPEWHIQDDVIPLLKKNWDLVIALPPCTHICVSGARYFAQKRKDGRQQEGIDFFMQFTKLNCAFAIENPVGIMSTIYRKPDQIIQPWYFGHPESKATCLWLNRLPLLIETNRLKTRKYWNNQTPSGQNRLGPSSNRSIIRSKTYSGIAKAMANQWGKLFL